MEEVVLQIGTICGLSQDSSLPGIRHYPICAEGSHIGHRVISRDLVSLADTLTPLERQRGMWQTCMYIPSLDGLWVCTAPEIFWEEDNSTPCTPLTA